MSNPIRHIAGPYEDGVQQCTRCLMIIIDRRDELQKNYDEIHDVGFPEGMICIGIAGKARDCFLGKERDCSPMEVGL